MNKSFCGVVCAPSVGVRWYANQALGCLVVNSRTLNSKAKFNLQHWQVTLDDLDNLDWSAAIAKCSEPSYSGSESPSAASVVSSPRYSDVEEGDEGAVVVQHKAALSLVQQETALKGMPTGRARAPRYKIWDGVGWRLSVSFSY